MRPRKLLLAAAALSTAFGCGGKKKEQIIYANPKGSVYDKGPLDAGTPEAIPADGAAGPPDVAPIPPPANPKGAYYDGGLGPPGALEE